MKTLPTLAAAFALRVTPSDTHIQAAKVGIVAEKKNVALYDGYLAAVKLYPDLTQVFHNLRSASLGPICRPLKRQRLPRVSSTMPNCRTLPCQKEG